MQKISDNLNDTVIRTNLKALMKHHGVTAVELARSIGASPESINKLRSGNLKNPTLKMLLGITKYFNISVENFVYDDLPNLANNNMINVKVSNIPIINWSNIDSWQTAKAKGYIVSSRLDANKCFALDIEHDSGEFVIGSQVIVSTISELVTNHYVLVRNIKENKFFISRLLIADDLYLQNIINGLNDINKYVESKQQIIGVVVASQKLF